MNMRTRAFSGLVSLSLLLACGGTEQHAECQCKAHQPAAPTEAALASSSPTTTEATPAPVASESPAPSGKRAPCTLGQDQTCNDDPAVSSLWGHCTELGVCECKPGFELSPRTARC